MKILFLILMSWIGLMSAQAQNKDWNQLLNDYLKLEDALVASNPDEAKEAITKMQKEVGQLQPDAAGKAYQKELKFLAAYLEVAGKATSLEDIRTRFEKISGSMIALAEQKVFGGEALYVMYCPMKKTSWLDDTKDVKNPYYGKAMLTCGSVKKTIN